MTPPHQGFESGDAPGLERDDRLVVHDERVVLDAVPQIGFEPQAGDRAVSHRRVEELAGRRRVALGAMESGRRIAQDLLRAVDSRSC